MAVSEFLLNQFKANYKKVWTQEEIETMAQSYFEKGKLTQDDLDSLDEFFNPTEIEDYAELES